MITKNQWILKFILPVSSKLDFYDIYCRFSIIVISPEKRWIFMVFTAKSQLFSTRMLDKF